jgi:hypothetical protein
LDGVVLAVIRIISTPSQPAELAVEPAVAKTRVEAATMEPANRAGMEPAAVETNPAIMESSTAVKPAATMWLGVSGIWLAEGAKAQQSNCRDS